MTQAPVSANEADARPRLKRKPGYVGGVHIGRLVLVEAVLLGIAAALPRGPIVAGATAFAGICVILVALLRSHGQWWLERRATSRQYAADAAGCARAVDPRGGLPGSQRRRRQRE